MTEYSKSEALTFIEVLRQTLSGKTGFKWFVETLSELSAYVERITAENDSLNAYLDWAHAREEYELYLQSNPCSSAE
jgi:hypothetical protein